jgi:hypothetical protein
MTDLDVPLREIKGATVTEASHRLIDLPPRAAICRPSLASQLAKRTTRRRAIKAALSGAVAGTLAQLAGGHTKAGKACANQCECPRNQTCIGNECVRGCAREDRTVWCKTGPFFPQGFCYNPRTQSESCSAVCR